MLIVFYGADGSGKSTVIQKLSECIEVDAQHFRPEVLTMKKTQENAGKIMGGRPYGANHYGPTKSFLKIVYSVLNYFLWGIINAKRINDPKQYIVFDRYYEDHIIDQKRMRLSGYVRTLEFLRFFVPSPHITISLIGDPVKISSRKNELTANEIEFLNKRYSLIKNAHVIDTTKLDSGQVLSNVLKILNENA